MIRTDKIQKEIQLIENMIYQKSLHISMLERYRFLSLLSDQYDKFFNMITQLVIEGDVSGEIENYIIHHAFINGKKELLDIISPNYFFKSIVNIASQKHPHIFHLFSTNILFHRKIYSFHGHNMPCILSVYFIIMIAQLRKSEHDMDIALLAKFYQDPIYNKAIKYSDNFLNNPCEEAIMLVQNQLDIQLKLNDYCYDIHNRDDPFVTFFENIKQTANYQKFYQQIIIYCQDNNIDYHDKMIFYIKDTAIGDRISRIRRIIKWSIKYSIDLIALTDAKTAAWIKEYFNDYIKDFICLDSDNSIPTEIYFTPIGKNTVVEPFFMKGLPINNVSISHNNCNITMCSASPLSHQHTQKLMQQYDLKSGKTVFLAPHSVSLNKKYMTDVTLLHFWKALIVQLQSKHYDVVVNIPLDQENIYEGATPLYIDLIDIIDFVNQAGFFIGLRSGLCDFIYEANHAKKYCIVPIEWAGQAHMDLGKEFCNIPLRPRYYHLYIDQIIHHMEQDNNAMYMSHS